MLNRKSEQRLYKGMAIVLGRFELIRAWHVAIALTAVLKRNPENVLKDLTHLVNKQRARLILAFTTVSCSFPCKVSRLRIADILLRLLALGLTLVLYSLLFFLLSLPLG